MSKLKKIILFEIIFFAALLAADLLSKHFVMKFLNENTVGYYVVIDKVLSLKYSLNDGAGFGILSGKMGFLIAFTSVALIFVTGLLIYFHIKRDTVRRGGALLVSSLIMILAGGLGNLVDRIAFGYVRDFIEYKFVETLFDRTFAICNIADVELTLGVIFLIIYVLFFYQDKKPVPAVDNPRNIAYDDRDDMNISEALKMYEDKHIEDSTAKLDEDVGVDNAQREIENTEADNEDNPDTIQR